MNGGTNVAESALNSSTSSGVVEFRNKMSSAFEMCQLWPINEEDYKVYIEKGEKFAEELKTKKVESRVETDDNNERDMTEEDEDNEIDDEDASDEDESQYQVAELFFSLKIDNKKVI